MHDIEAGEELDISYIEETMTRAHRQLKLSRSWGFDCSCEHCEDTPENTVLEQKRARLADIDGELKLIQLKLIQNDGPGRDERRLALYQEKAGILEALDLRQYDLSQWSVKSPCPFRNPKCYFRTESLASGPISIIVWQFWRSDCLEIINTDFELMMLNLVIASEGS